MKVALVYNKDLTAIINRLGIQNKEIYDPKTVKNVADALEKGGHNVRIIDGNMHVIEEIQDFMPRVVQGERMGMVFNMAYGIQGESRYTHLPSMLEMLGIPYVGSSPAGHTLALDKMTTKIIMQKYGIPTPDYWMLNEAIPESAFPLIVKPKMEAVSEGIKIVYNESELTEAVDAISSSFNQPAVIERFIPGREFCVGILGNGDPEAFPVLEIDLGNDPYAVQTESDKKQAPRRKLCPADLPEEVAENMISLSKQAFRALNLRDFARVDIRMDANNAIYLLEVNSMASLGSTGSYVAAAKVAGYDFTRLVNRMLDVAAVRYFSDTTLTREESVFQKKEKEKLPLSARVRGFLRSKEEETEKLLEQMININSYVRDITGVNDLGILIEKRLVSLGFSKDIFYNAEMGNTLLFTNTKDAQLDILLLAHLDNAISYQEQTPYHMTQSKIYGTSVWENKGGLAVMIAALRTLRYLRLLSKMRVGILLIPDNTLKGRITRDLVEKTAERSHMVVGLSGASLGGEIITSRPGSAAYTYEMKLINPKNATHVADMNVRFYNLLTKLTKLSDLAGGVAVIPHSITMKSDFIPPFSRGECVLSVRFQEAAQGETIDKKIRVLIAKEKSRTISHRFDGAINRYPFMRTAAVGAMYDEVRKLGEMLDIRITEEHRWGSSDICFVTKDMPKLDGFGPIGAAPRNDDEYILRHSIPDRAALLTFLMINHQKV